MIRPGLEHRRAPLTSLEICKLPTKHFYPTPVMNKTTMAFSRKVALWIIACSIVFWQLLSFKLIAHFIWWYFVTFDSELASVHYHYNASLMHFIWLNHRHLHRRMRVSNEFSGLFALVWVWYWRRTMSGRWRWGDLSDFSLKCYLSRFAGSRSIQISVKGIVHL